VQVMRHGLPKALRFISTVHDLHAHHAPFAALCVQQHDTGTTMSRDPLM